jgi:hypothetical protein
VAAITTTMMSSAEFEVKFRAIERAHGSHSRAKSKFARDNQNATNRDMEF